jgi:pimeloyl-ACP methyl ester carboxylesterase
MVGVPGTEGRTLVYRNFPLGARNPAITRAVVMIPGLLRDAADHFRWTLAGAFLAGALEDTLIVAPRFASSEGSPCDDTLAPGEAAWHCHVRNDSWHTGGVAVAGTATTFDVVDEIVRKLARKEGFPNLRAVVVAGHSGGGQFVARYAMTNVVHDSVAARIAYLVANPSSYTYLDEMRPTVSAVLPHVYALAPGYHDLPETPRASFRVFPDARNCTGYDHWPYGMQSRNGYAARVSDAQMKRNLAQRPATLLLGEFDIVPVYGFDASCAAMAQGGTRVARGLAYAKYVNERFGAKYEAVVVNTCAHSAHCMLTSDTVLPLLFPK